MASLDRDNWDRHWDDYNQSAQVNPALAYRRRVIFSLLGLRGSGRGVRLLDIGSGQGDMAVAVRARFPSAEILGLELSQAGVEISRRKVPDAQFVQRNLLDNITPPQDQRGWATHAVCSEVIEHVDDPCQLLKSAREYMGPGCLLVVTAPGGPMSAFDRHIGHRKHFRPSEIDPLLRQAGYETERVMGAGFPFFNLYRGLVVLRGKKLIEDASVGRGQHVPLPARAAMAVFHQLFRLNLESCRWGWQMVGKARLRNSNSQ
ncbi:MAG TPA: class I SAM-dependent methyltransferase [Terriglobia bacterium]|nr:class I SAM-dependent methyltransferase [Terriglobia bacterium]